MSRPPRTTGAVTTADQCVSPMACACWARSSIAPPDVTSATRAGGSGAARAGVGRRRRRPGPAIWQTLHRRSAIEADAAGHQRAEIRRRAAARPCTPPLRPRSRADRRAAAGGRQERRAQPGWTSRRGGPGGRTVSAKRTRRGGGLHLGHVSARCRSSTGQRGEDQAQGNARGGEQVERAHVERPGTPKHARRRTAARSGPCVAQPRAGSATEKAGHAHASATAGGASHATAR